MAEAQGTPEPEQHFFRAEQPQQQEDPSNPSPPAAESAADQDITWTASEFIAHDKSSGWYGMLVLGTLAAAGLAFLVTRDYVSVAVVIVAGMVLGVYAGHQPRQLEYKLDKKGFSIAGKRHAFNEFRCFTVEPEGAFAGITFMPLKRFAAPITIYYAPDDEKKVMDLLSAQLPFEEYRADAVDNLMKRIRF